MGTADGSTAKCSPTVLSTKPVWEIDSIRGHSRNQGLPSGAATGIGVCIREGTRERRRKEAVLSIEREMTVDLMSGF